MSVLNHWASRRAIRSLLPPGENGTTIRTERVGQASAAATVKGMRAKAAASDAVATQAVIILRSMR
jgi:hypothetical protein